MKWSILLPIFLALVVIAEIVFLGRLDMPENAALVNSWAGSFFYGSAVSVDMVEGADFELESVSLGTTERTLGSDSCEEWLEKEDAVVYARNFDIDPILVTGDEKEWMTCGVGCQFGFNPSKSPDATFGFPQQGGTASVLRSMESASYYSENNIAHARRMGFNVVMTASLSSDVPVGYFSWAEYNIMAPVQPKTEKALAVAFISNCGAHNFRLQALNVLEKLIKIGFYGSCHRNHDGKGSWLLHFK